MQMQYYSPCVAQQPPLPVSINDSLMYAINIPAFFLMLAIVLSTIAIVTYRYWLRHLETGHEQIMKYGYWEEPEPTRCRRCGRPFPVKEVE